MYYAVKIQEKNFHKGCCVYNKTKEIFFEKSQYKTWGDLLWLLNDKYLRTSWLRKRYSILDVREVEFSYFLKTQEETQ
tara:strand:+ start:916 stop:1149 length:234 start_codon:yes stop_codon:yes gene_type:complete